MVRLRGSGRHAARDRGQAEPGLNQALELPAIRARFKELGLNPEGGTPERFGEHIDAEHAKWKSIVAAAGITPN
jgi:tripartite-type tricarboxylate transporter receptor subunit TctC